LEIEGLSSTDESSSDESEWEYRGTMVLQSKKNSHNTLPKGGKAKGGKDEVKLLIDSGCDTLAMMHRSDGFDWRPAKMMVDEATEGRTTLVGCKGKVELEFPMGGKLAVSDAIYSKDFRHNLCGTSTLGKAGISTLMHEGKVFLIEAKSMGELPNAWKVRACEGVDSDTGLPFIVMKRQPPRQEGTALEKEVRQKREDVTRVKQKNASWRRQEASTPINSTKRERKVSRKGWAMGEEELRARSRQPPKEEEMRFKGGERPKEINAIWRSHQGYPERKISSEGGTMGGEEFLAHSRNTQEDEEFKKGQEQQKKFRTQGKKTGNLPREKGAQSVDNALSEKMVATQCANTTSGHSINTALKKTLMASKLKWFSINSSGNGRTRLLVPPRTNH
jgi:hypothetical protein